VAALVFYHLICKALRYVLHCVPKKPSQIFFPFIDSSADNVLFQTLADLTSRLLNSSTFLNVIW